MTGYCVYRRRNAEVVRRLLDPALAAGWAVGLWALDEPHPDLAEHTAGSGPGTKFAPVNRLLAVRPPSEGHHVVVFDDDAVFARGDLPDFVRPPPVAAAPRPGSARTHALRSNDQPPDHLDGARCRARVRLTTFVEMLTDLCRSRPAGGWARPSDRSPSRTTSGWAGAQSRSGRPQHLRRDRYSAARPPRSSMTPPVRHLARFATTAYAPDEEIARLRPPAGGARRAWLERARRTLAVWRPVAGEAALGRQSPSRRS